MTFPYRSRNDSRIFAVSMQTRSCHSNLQALEDSRGRAWPCQGRKGHRMVGGNARPRRPRVCSSFRYGRTFGSGSRSGVQSSTVADLGAKHAESHAYFKALRDKYIAHSVSELEGNQVFVVLRPQLGEDQSSAHITADRGRLVGLGADDIERLLDLSVAVREAVKHEIASESDRILAIARSMPIEEIQASVVRLCRSKARLPFSIPEDDFRRGAMTASAVIDADVLAARWGGPMLRQSILFEH